jgi:hypothetical protein
MSEKKAMSRRDFVAGASGLVLAGAATKARGDTAADQGSQLAIDGGEKAVKESPKSAPRWGETEQNQLSEMLQQGSLFYWKGPQTELLKKRFQEVLPRRARAELAHPVRRRCTSP